eukprot:CAMPEP_0168517520 /NCGR_PEP_ID=MMETSP0405-20121227/6092_1 /TAXON_ID=498012 /ORGANISM="Trichosphaerium sp, Strain Am-I-7 wt" /LENGTH=94 /DNA_ID=CAMNT_0008537529 /DNA_START=147 /DNA_END=431 /DNA_ORIENTATION=-
MILDKCAHMGIQLSRMGELSHEEGNCTLRCGFHGWEFDELGACVHIPTADVDASVRIEGAVPRFECREQHGHVWVWMGEDEPTTLHGASNEPDE